MMALLGEVGEAMPQAEVLGGHQQVLQRAAEADVELPLVGVGHRLFGLVTVGLVLGLLQFASTIAITVAYVRFARNRLVPQVAAIRAGAGVADR